MTNGVIQSGIKKRLLQEQKLTGFFYVVPLEMRRAPGPGDGDPLTDGVAVLPDEHPLQQLLVSLRVAGPVLLHILVHTVLQRARAVLGIHVGHLQDRARDDHESILGGGAGRGGDRH